MNIKKTAKRVALTGFICGLGSSMGCNDGRPAADRIDSTADRAPVVVNRPVLPESKSVVEPLDRTNTGLNERDRSNTAAKTSFDQNETKTDINTTAEIRKRVVDTKMSVTAQNVKIITENGRVTLRGPVQSAEEKQRIEEIAGAVAGASNVDSQLEINRK